MMWDSRSWTGTLVEAGQYSITYEFVSTHNLYTWYLTGVYAPHTRDEKLNCWEELAAVRTICDGPWVTCGDFITNRTMEERKRCNRISFGMSDFSTWIHEMELHDPHLHGGDFTWFRGFNHPSAARLDRFLFFMEWEEKFKNIKQKLLPIVLSDYCPVMLECGNWEKQRSNFKFENWWIKVEGFTELIQVWWNEFLVEGCPDYRLNIKLKMLKEKLNDWSKANFGMIANKKNSLLEELAEIDELQGTRDLTEDEMMVRATIVVELEELAKNEESRWRQKSRVLWLKQGDNNTRFFQRMATSHWRNNTIDRLIDKGEIVEDTIEIRNIMIEFYRKLYTQSENWKSET
ncbi:hypothetical protein RDI58_001160 [Solanum bulbocastanum]|uniref:Uncharacterized protein n=1 Tax=Solanum bulbocastanum TaxID=147425 RepID=A0AAN8UDT1_SOLBU